MASRRTISPPKQGFFCDYDDTDAESNITHDSGAYCCREDHYHAQNLDSDSDNDVNESNDHIHGSGIHDGDEFDAYFTQPETRNAQTVSWKQRHRPIF